MVTPPALQAATKALLQLQQSTKLQHAHTGASKPNFSAELTRHLAAQSVQSQTQALVSGLARPIVFIPMAAEIGAASSSACTTQRRSKKQKDAKTKHNGQPVAPFLK